MSAIKIKSNIVKILIFLRKGRLSRGTLFLSAVLFAFVFLGGAAAGAVMPNTDSDFSVEFNPEVPGPNERVSAKAVSYNFDVNRSYISWFVNGKLKLRGIGEKNFSFTVGDRGEKISIRVSLANENGADLSETFYFTPAEVDLLWEAKTYTPFFYKGKAMPSPGAEVRMAAIPHFNEYAAKNSSNLVYKWKLNHKNMPKQSGAGMNYFTFKTRGPLSESIVGVEVSDYKRTVVAENSVRIVNRDPELLFYRDRPMEGIDYGSAIEKEFDFSGNEISIRAEPYFFPKKALRAAKYDWKMNNRKIHPEGNKNTVNFGFEPGSSGSALIWLKISNPYRILQFAEKAFSINFGL